VRGYLRQRPGRPEGYWELTVEAPRDPTTGQRRRVTRGYRGTKREAERALSKLVSEVDAGRQTQKRGTLGDLLEQWLDQAKDRLSPTTVREYRRLVDKRILPALGNKALHKLSPVDLDRFYITLVRRNGLAAGSVRQVHAILHRALRQAVRWGWIVTNPATQASPPGANRPEVRPLAPETVLRLIAAADVADPEFATFLRLAASTGARRGELCALRWRDVDLELGEVLIARAVIELAGGGPLHEKDTKTHAARRLSLGASTVASLQAHRATMEQRAALVRKSLVADPFLFSDDLDAETGWRPDHVTKKFGSLCRSVGVSARLHDLRHFSVTRLLAAGVDVGTVADRHGHKDAAVTLNVYRHWVPAADRTAGEVLDRLLKGAQSTAQEP
jgi:integrase